ncbi:MAG: 50S ribosomal protein L6 [Nitrosomonas sp.]|nr:50S ribosomal protein L6 [Nitrosomonas sp.]
MSRISKKPISISNNIELSVDPNEITVKGPLGTLRQPIPGDLVKVERNGDLLQVNTLDSSKHAHSMSGTIRSLISNMVIGVTAGFERKLNVVGVGYRVQAAGDTLNMNLGFSHPIAYKMPVGIRVETPSQTEIVIKGVDKQQVGQVAAELRAFRPPEPYKGKGVRYSDEVIVLKETKKK